MVAFNLFLIEKVSQVVLFDMLLDGGSGIVFDADCTPERETVVGVNLKVLLRHTSDRPSLRS
jgi:hypothetical protein